MRRLLVLLIPLVVLSGYLVACERSQAGAQGQGQAQSQAQNQPQTPGQGAGPVQGQPPGPGRFSPKLGGEYTNLVSAELAKGPVPRLPDGHPDLSGPWVGGGSNDDIEEQGGLKPGELPLLPWAKELREARKEDNEPYLYCTPMSVPRMNPYPWRFVHSQTSKGLGTIYVIHENGDAGAVRQIFMDGRKHPDPDTWIPTWWGHSIGRWEGDTLVIDTVGYNDKFWFDSRGTPHTEKLHTIERWTRPNFGTLVDNFTLDDPGALSRPVDLKFEAKLLAPGEEMLEFVCTDNNQYGIASQLPNIYKDKGFGLEVTPP